MKWKLEDRPEAVVVTLQSNPVNKQNPEFVADLHDALDQLDEKYPMKPAVLTAQGKIFSAGLDLDYVFPMFARGDMTEVRRWFTEYRGCMMRVLKSPRLTIAALNGHAFAGGMVLALCCDFRIAPLGSGAKFSLNEVPVGIPMPSVYTELIRHRLGSASATEAILLGKAYTGADAVRVGYLGKEVPGDSLVEAALEMARQIPSDCRPAFAQSKAALLHPVLGAIDSFSEKLDEETYRVLISPASVAVHSRIHEQLKKRS